MDPPSRCRVELDLDALRTNLDRVRVRLAPDAPLIAMVKADAYGLGVEHVVPVLREAGVRCFGVAAASEARALRAMGGGPGGTPGGEMGVEDRIVVFGPFARGMEREVVAAGAEATVSDVAGIEAFAAAALEAARETGPDVGRAAGRDARVPLHLEIDTGMGRSGVRPEVVESRAGELVEALSGEGVRWAGVFTHLHSADEPGWPDVRAQLDAFRRLVDRLSPPGHVEVHVANSAAAFWDGLPGGVGARPGIYLYGGAVPGAPPPDPVAHLRARIVRVVDVPPGATVGYGATHRATAPERWATAAIGYGDGLPRALSNRGRALIHGRPVPVVGRVSMDLTVLDVSGRTDIRPGDDATFLGVDGSATITPEEIAGHADTISYEILTRFTPRVPRVAAAAPQPAPRP